jgi:ABC-type uncharacterized transport system ATPase subunit
MRKTSTAQQVRSVSSQLTKGEVLLRATKVVKGFPGVWEHLILDEVDFDVKSGEVRVILGENGAGKTVLANVLSGFYLATRGEIYVRGKPATINSPEDALKLGIGMVHQEFTLVRPFTVAENVALGLKTKSLAYPIREVERRLNELSARYNLKVDPKAKVESLSVGEQQRAEILKVLYHNPDVIILDEPTSVLTPRETEQLFQILRGLADEGKGVVLITHKLEDVMRNSDRVTVLKLGKSDFGTTALLDSLCDFGQPLEPRVQWHWSRPHREKSSYRRGFCGLLLRRPVAWWQIHGVQRWSRVRTGTGHQRYHCDCSRYA